MTCLLGSHLIKISLKTDSSVRECSILNIPQSKSIITNKRKEHYTHQLVSPFLVFSIIILI